MKKKDFLTSKRSQDKSGADSSETQFLLNEETGPEISRTAVKKIVEQRGVLTKIWPKNSLKANFWKK